MSEALITPTESKPTIHDAIDALFAQKEADAAKAPKVEAAPAPTEVTADASTEAAPETAEVVETVAPPEATKVTASDYAIKLARLKKKQVAAPAPTGPSPELVARAQAIQAAGGDPIKAFEAAGFDLATIVQAYDKQITENPAEYDPLAVQLRSLAQELAQYKKQAEAEKEARSVASFDQTVAERVKSSGDEFEYVAAEGAEGIELVRELVLQAGRQGKVLPYLEAMKKAEAHYEAKADKLLKTKKAASKFTTQTRKPGIAQQSPITGAAPTPAQTKPKQVSDVIADSIDALFAGR